jgi:hypothetical protein
MVKAVIDAPTRPEGTRSRRRARQLLAWLASIAVSVAGSVPAVAAVPDAGAPPADAGAIPEYAQDFRRQAQQIHDFLAGHLDGAIAPQSLFDVPIDASDDEMQVERERIEVFLRRAAVPAPATSRAESPPAQGQTARSKAGAKPSLASVEPSRPPEAQETPAPAPPGGTRRSPKCGRSCSRRNITCTPRSTGSRRFAAAIGAVDRRGWPSCSC